MKFKKKLVSLVTAFTIAISMICINASAFMDAQYFQTTGGQYTKPVYVSCYVTGVRVSGVVTGSAWTKTSSNNNNVYTPNCAFAGYTYVSTQVGGIASGATNNNTGSAQTDIYLTGCTTPKTVNSQHIFSSTYYGSVDHTFNLMTT